MKPRLQVRQHGINPFDVVDAHGEPLYVDDICRVITNDHNWLKKGALLRVTKDVRPSLRPGVAGISYQDEKRSQSAIGSDEIERVADGEPIFRKRELRWRRAHLTESITKKQIELEDVVRELETLGEVKVDPIICENCGSHVGE